MNTGRHHLPTSPAPPPAAAEESRPAWLVKQLHGASADARVTGLTAAQWRAIAGEPEVGVQIADAYAQAVGRRIAEARKAIGMKNREELARLLQVHENTLGKIERGETMADALQLVRIAAITARPVMWFIGDETHSGSEVPHALEAVEIGETLYVPLFDVRASAGTGAFNDMERVFAMRPFPLDYIRRDLGIRHNLLALLTIVGTSAEPDVHSGDTGLIDRKDRDLAVEGLHLVRIDEGLLLKMIQRRPGGVLRVYSKNQESSPFDIDVREGTHSDFEVIGRLRWAGVRFN